MTTLITVLGSLVAAVMALGAVFGALNTMYSAVSERSREIAVLRAIGFGGGAIVLSFFVESLLIALVGGLVGCVAVLPVNGLTTGTINWQTFSHLAFAFRITPDLLALGMLFALVMGAVGGLPPADPRGTRQRRAHAQGALGSGAARTRSQRGSSSRAPRSFARWQRPLDSLLDVSRPG